MEKKVNILILVLLPGVLILHSGNTAHSAEQSKSLKEAATSTMPPQKKKGVPDKYATLKKYLKIGVGIGTAAASIYLGKSLLEGKAKEDRLTTLLTSESWQGICPLSSIYIGNVLYQNNEKMQETFKKTLAILTRGYIPDYYFPFGCTIYHKKIDKRALLTLSKDDIAYVQSFSNDLFKDFQNDARFSKNQSRREALWKRFTEYKKMDPWFCRMAVQASIILSLEERYRYKRQQSKKLTHLITTKFKESTQDEYAQEAYKILQIFHSTNGKVEDINPNNFPLIASKLAAEAPDKESNY